MNWRNAILFFIGAAFLIAHQGFAATYHVGPKQKLENISDVPWESLKAGDEVLIEWRPEPYREKFVICHNGTERAPVVVRGIPNATGKLPVIDGNGARTRKQLSYWGDSRGTVKIGGATIPKGLGAEYIVIENLEIRGARPPYSFITSKGETKPYHRIAAALYVEKAHHLTVRNCILTDSTHGLFVSSNNESVSSDILIEKCHIYGNGMEKSGQHNIYTAAVGITFQFNHLGALRPGCVGNNLKDRSAGTVIRYNWIEGGDKQLDLVDAEDSAIIRNEPSYRRTYVYGNIFIKPATAAHNQVVHYGGDSSKTANYRKGMLYFFNNTIVSYRKDPMNLFWLSTDEERCDFRNNIVYSTTNGKFSPVKDKGIIQLSHNCLPEHWNNSAMPRETIKDNGTSFKMSNPGFVNTATQDFRLAGSSKCRDSSSELPKELSTLLTSEYLKHQESKPRAKDQRLDVGAYEYDGSR